MSDCINWSGYTDDEGYAVTTVDNVWAGVHVHAYIVAYGPVPDGLVIDHLCVNPSCVNPEHLEAVTPYENFLRSNAPAAINKRKTHCVRNHEFTKENTHVRPNGKRDCIQCYLDRRSKPNQSKWMA